MPFFTSLNCVFLFELINILFEYISSKINIPFHIIQQVNTLYVTESVGKSPTSAVVFKGHWPWSIQFMLWLTHLSKWQIFKNIKHFNCSLDLNLTHLLTVRVIISSNAFFGGGENFFIDFWQHWCWKCLQICCWKTLKPPWTFLVAMLFTLWLCCVFPFHWSELYRSSQNWRQDLFQKLMMYQWTQTPSWLLSISRLIWILMRVISLTNGKPCRCHYMCGHMIFMTWIISLNNFTVMW